MAAICNTLSLSTSPLTPKPLLLVTLHSTLAPFIFVLEYLAIYKRGSSSHNNNNAWKNTHNYWIWSNYTEFIKSAIRKRDIISLCKSNIRIKVWFSHQCVKSIFYGKRDHRIIFTLFVLNGFLSYPLLYCR